MSTGEEPSPLAGGEPPDAAAAASESARKRHRRTKAEVEAEKVALAALGKRKRGRPSKEDLAARNMVLQNLGLAVAQTPPPAGGEAGGPGGSGAGPSGVPARKRERKKKNGEGALVGRTVEGILDGSFEAGYFITIKCVEGVEAGDGDMALRGVVFRPGIAVPLSHTNDIAAAVPFVGAQTA